MMIHRARACLLSALLTASLVTFSAEGQALTADPVEGLGEAPIAGLLERLGEDVALYDMHVVTLSNPFFEGRGSTTIGNERAADYLAWHFEAMGLVPAFSETDHVDGVEVVTANATYSQPFAPSEVRGRRGPRPVRVLGSEASMRLGEGKWGQLIDGLDYSVLGCSGSGEVEGELVFVGYSIAAGQNGYLGYPPGTSLKGKVAVALRYEPVDEAGASKWAESGSWSIHAPIEAKVSSAARRGAAAVIIVTPPGIPGEDAAELLEPGETADGEFEIPVIMLSQERADFLLSKADPEGRSLLELRKLVDGSPAIIEMPGASVKISTDVDRTPDMTRNVGGLLRGKGSLADEIVVVGAHFDHVGYGRSGDRTPENIHAGADDNASGTSAMLLAAARLSERYAGLPADAEARSILFLGFSAEEMGLLGSRFYAEHPMAPIEDHVFMFNMDMVGRVRDGALHVGGQTTAEGLGEWAQPFLDSAGFDIQPLPRGVFGRSDQASFFRAGVPCMFFFSGFHDDYHKPGDVSVLINRVGAVRVSTMCQEMVMAMATRPDRPVFVDDDGSGRRDTQRPPAVRPQGARIRFGARPQYEYSGEGVFIEGVSEGTSAAEAGLQAGDVITHWSGTKVSSLEEYAAALGTGKPGDEVEITFVRDGETRTVKVTLKAPD